MQKLFIVALLLASQSTLSSGAVVTQSRSRIASSLEVQSNHTAKFTLSQSLWNTTFTNMFQREFHMRETSEQSKPVNKLVWVIFVMMFGVCGCDRCFIGAATGNTFMIVLGVIKGLTFGGCIFWHLVDYFCAVFNALMKKKTMTWVGYDMVFEPQSIDSAFWFCLIVFLFQICQNLSNAGNANAQMKMQQAQQAELLRAMEQQQKDLEKQNQAKPKAAPKEGDADASADEPEKPALDIPTRHQSLAYVPTMFTKGLRKAGIVQEQPTIPELIAAFEEMDKDGDGQLDHEEIKEGLKAMGASDETVDEMIKTCDTDGDGKISKSEFLAAHASKDK